MSAQWAPKALSTAERNCERRQTSWNKLETIDANISDPLAMNVT